MAYPPPNADQYSINGYKFFRLNTLLTSDGDIYESAQGAQGFAIGPDSDISKVNIGYFDDQVERFLNQVAISPGRAFPGIVAARNDAVYVPANRPGRILIWPDEIYNPTYMPDFGVDVAGRIDFEVPVLDVAQYFAPGGLSMNDGRNDKEYWYDFIPYPAINPGETAAWALILPWYGRRLATATWLNGGAGPVTFDIAGLHYKPGTANTAAVRSPLRTAAVAGSAVQTEIILASNDGTYDALEFRFTGTNASRLVQSTLRIRTSDREN